MGHPRHVNSDLLKTAARKALVRLFETFGGDFASRNIRPPDPSLPPEEYFRQAAIVVDSLETLPDGMAHALSHIADAVTAEPQQHVIKTRYALRKGLGAWHLFFNGQEAYIRHQRGLYYVAWLLYHPPEHPLHGLDLVAKIPDFYRKQLGLPSLVDPATGRTSIIESGARLQERSLSLDNAEIMRAHLRLERKLKAILESEDATEDAKAEALEELEQIAEFKLQHGRRTIDAAQRTARTVREAIYRLHRHLFFSFDEDGRPHPVLRPFALHIQNHIIIPSGRYSGHGTPHARSALSGSFTYEPPPGVIWRP